MGQKTVLLNEDSHSWGSKLVLLLVPIPSDKTTCRAGIKIIRGQGPWSSFTGDDILHPRLALATIAGLEAEDHSEAMRPLRNPGGEILPHPRIAVVACGDSPAGMEPGQAIDNVIRVGSDFSRKRNAPKI